MNQFINNSANHLEDEPSIDIKSYLKRVLSDWWVIVVCLIICMVSVFIYLRYKTPMYKINAKLLVKDEQKGGSVANAGDAFDLGGLLNMKSNVDNEVEILKTRNLMERVVKAMNLNIIYYRKGTFKDLELESSPFVVELIRGHDTINANTFHLLMSENERSFDLSYQNNGKKEIIKNLRFGDSLNIKGTGRFIINRNHMVPMTAKEYFFNILSVDVRVASLQRALKVSVTNKLVTTIDLQLNYSIPQKGEKILSKFIEEYVNQNINDKNLIADSTIAFIENRLLLVGGELGNIEGGIQSFKQVNKLADLSEQSKLLVASTSEYIKQLSAIETQINVMKVLEEYLKQEVKNTKVVPTLPDNEAFRTLAETYNTILQERNRQLLTQTEGNPYIRNLDDGLADLRSAMVSNLAGARRSLEINRDELKKELNKLEKNIHQVPAQERTYLDLSRQQQIKQELYLFLLQKREEMAISKTSNISNAQIIDLPKSEFGPYSPNRGMIQLIGLLIALGLPFFRVIVLDLFNDKVESKEEVVKITKLPVLGEISHNDSNEELVISKNPRSVIAEQFRALRTNLQFYLNAQKGNVILLTSSMSGEGKSFMAANLGTVLAISGKKVLLMELDLRKPNLSIGLHINNDFGFTNYIVSPEVKISDVIITASIHENLFIIPSGPLPPNPAEIIMNERMEKMMKELKEEYHYIIIDAPPIGIVTDAQLLNQYASLTLYLVRQKYTFKDQLSIPKDLYDHNKIQKMGIVINDVKNMSGYGYGGYGYGLEEKKTWRQKIKKFFRL